MLHTAIHRARPLDASLAGVLVRVAARRVGCGQRGERAEQGVAARGREVGVLLGEEGE